MDFYFYSPMVFGLILILVGLVYISRPGKRFKKKIFGGKIDYLQPLFAFVFVPLLFSIIFFALAAIVSRPRVALVPFGDLGLLFLLSFLLLFAAIGTGIHFSAKVVSWALGVNPNTAAYKVNHFFHIPLSHGLAFIPAVFSSLLIVILEINHPLSQPVPSKATALMACLGLLTGGLIAVLVFKSYVIKEIVYSGLVMVRLSFVAASLFLSWLIFIYRPNFYLLPWALVLTFVIAFSTLFILLFSFSKRLRGLVDKIE